jgi:hypothetical protein
VVPVPFVPVPAVSVPVVVFVPVPVVPFVARGFELPVWAIAALVSASAAAKNSAAIALAVVTRVLRNFIDSVLHQRNSQLRRVLSPTIRRCTPSLSDRLGRDNP